MNENLLSTCELLNRILLRACAIKKKMCVFLRGCILTGLAIIALSAPAVAGTVEKDVTDAIDSNAKYLFYMHGFAIEQGGPRARSYDYSGILKELAKRGFVVIGEERSRVRNDVYANKVAGQVGKLLAANVPAKNITVAGHSKGGMITMLVMSMLANPEIAYVNFAGCGKEGSGFEGYLQFAQNRASMAQGRLLSAYDRSDQIAGSCKPALDKMSNAVVTERVLNIGGGHELFYTPKPEWLDILQAWAERRQQ
ncbi:MAG: hypothetical protein HZA59_09360 [Hydrogenophilales bacterium]|nr:hypothetical protein [Hydrogenophilales bacterium]